MWIEIQYCDVNLWFQRYSIVFEELINPMDYFLQTHLVIIVSLIDSRLMINIFPLNPSEIGRFSVIERIILASNWIRARFVDPNQIQMCSGKCLKTAHQLQIIELVRYVSNRFLLANANFNAKDVLQAERIFLLKPFLCLLIQSGFTGPILR